MGIALYDILGTVGLAVLTFFVLGVNVVYAFVGWFVIAEILHYAFGVRTAFLRGVGLAPRCS